MNVQHKIVGSKLVIEVDLAQEGKLSSSGKSLVIGTTSGFKNVDGKPGVQFGLNVIQKH